MGETVPKVCEFCFYWLDNKETKTFVLTWFPLLLPLNYRFYDYLMSDSDDYKTVREWETVDEQCQ